MRMALAVLVLVATCAAQQRPKSEIPEIKAELGPCSAEFRVTDTAGAGLYNVKISTVVRYGFLSKRKLELEAATNADGIVRFVQLPSQAKKPIDFTITNDVETVTRNFDPETNCHATYDVKLRTK